VRCTLLPRGSVAASDWAGNSRPRSGCNCLCRRAWSTTRACAWRPPRPRAGARASCSTTSRSCCRSSRRRPRRRSGARPPAAARLYCQPPPPLAPVTSAVAGWCMKIRALLCRLAAWRHVWRPAAAPAANSAGLQVPRGDVQRGGRPHPRARGGAAGVPAGRDARVPGGGPALDGVAPGRLGRQRHPGRRDGAPPRRPQLRRRSCIASCPSSHSPVCAGHTASAVADRCQTWSSGQLSSVHAALHVAERMRCGGPRTTGHPRSQVRSMPGSERAPEADLALLGARRAWARRCRRSRS